MRTLILALFLAILPLVPASAKTPATNNVVVDPSLIEAHPELANQAPLITKEPTDPAQLSAQETADVARIETYLNEMKNMSADFIQVDDSGGMMRGKIDIQRPGKMRIKYDPPDKDFIVADGDSVHIWNDDLKEQTNVDEGSSLAEFILRDPVELKGDVTITKFERLPSKIELTLIQTSDPGAGTLTMIFEDHPLILRQWRVVDPQGRTTGVSLENERTDVTFKHSTFTFVPPNFAKSPKSQIPDTD